MRINHSLRAAALATALFGAAPLAMAAQQVVTPPVTPPETTQAASPMTEADVRAAMAAEGYTGINDVHFKEGVWTADAKSADGNHVEVKVDAMTGKIIPDEHVAKVSKDQVIVKVQDAGYTNVHDVDFEGGVWKVEAKDSAGADVELKVDPDDGHILGSERDEIGGKKH
jgi:uncharacterized membrane protein YkoI